MKRMSVSPPRKWDACNLMVLHLAVAASRLDDATPERDTGAA